MASIVAIVGPTATGKSALAMHLAEACGGEIINADALQVYRGFDIGTAKPNAAERARVAHHLLDLLEPSEQYSAGEFARRALIVIEDLERRGLLPLVVGGSGFYVRALVEGISPLPATPPELRRELSGRLDTEGLEALRTELRQLDPETEARLAQGDTQRVLRALEVALATGRPLSEWIADRPFGEQRIAAVRIGLTLPRPILYDRIERRVARMVEAGWVTEVASHLRRGHELSAPAFAAIGYRQLTRHIEGEWSLEQAVQSTVRDTRRFAKRQETWFRREPGIHWFSALEVEQDPSQVIEFVRRETGGR